MSYSAQVQAREKAADQKLRLVLSNIAQGAINIDSGLVVIQAGSAVHMAMHGICAMVQTPGGRAAIRRYLEVLEDEARQGGA